MLDDATMAVITGAAGNLAAYMLSGRVDAARGWLTRIYRSEPEADRLESIRALNADAAALAQHTRSETEMRAWWISRFTLYLAAHPEAATDLKALANVEAVTETQNVGSQHNNGSGTFIGRDNHGQINPGTIQEPR